MNAIPDQMRAMQITQLGEITSTRPVEHYARIVEARTGPAGVDLVLPGGETIPAGEVGALRRPPDP